ncbi:ribonuclease H-like protein [Exidia glandulosa HHB12029]|uniref:Ribonuclease H n=1 Tax=Exidia glandulosa HHB12029 TaxID=1314781 RepID=A0A165DFS4_EXIGL|nr:ribonuclease H-like protein [Exidia glandulosa HHB12029]
MPKAPTSKSKPSKGGYYAVVAGYTPGIYTTWDDAERQVKGFPKPVHKKFKTLHEAEAFIAALRARAGPSTSSSSQQMLVAFPVRTGPSGASVRVPAPVNSSKKGKEKARTDQRPSPFEDVPAEEEHLWEVIYTDGACSNNGKGAHLALAGVGVWYGHGDPRNISERCPGDQTNNRAELIAIIRALEEIPPSETETEKSKPLLIKTDSKYSIQSVYSWVPNFMHKAQLAEQAANKALEAARTPSEISKAQMALDAAKVWKTSDGKNVKNQALLHYLVTLLQYRKRVLKQEWRLQYVKGHSGEVGNEGADGLAVGGARMGWVEEDDWDAKREGLQDQIDGTFLAWGDRDKDTERAKEVGLDVRPCRIAPVRSPY